MSQKYLCIGGPLAGTETYIDEAVKKGYIPFNCARSRHRKDKIDGCVIPKCVLLHSSAFATQEYAQTHKTDDSLIADAVASDALLQTGRSAEAVNQMMTMTSKMNKHETNVDILDKYLKDL